MEFDRIQILGICLFVFGGLGARFISGKLNSNFYRVLIADDDEEIRACFKDVAAGENWNLYYACNGEECLRKIQSDNPHLVILDQRMPKFTGQQVLEKMRENHLSIPVLMISSEEDIPGIENFKSLVRVLHKPFNLDRLVIVVNEMLVFVE